MRKELAELMMKHGFATGHGSTISDLLRTFDEELRSRHTKLFNVVEAARDLYDSKLGWSDNRPPYAPVSFWENLDKALSSLGESDV